MATEFARWSTSNQYGTYSYILTYDLLSQSIANNTSTIRVYGIIQLPVYISWSRGTATVHTASFGLGKSYSAGNHQIGYTDVTIAHNNDGTGSVYIGGSISTSYLMNGSCGGTITLPTIARNAVTNSVTGSDIEGNFSVDYTKYVSSFTYKLRISLPNIRMLETIPYNTSGATLTLSEETIEDLFTTYSTSNSFNLGFAIETWNGSTQISTGNEKIITAKILNANPTFNDFEFEDLNSDTVALTGDDQAIIKGYSNIEIRIPISDKAIANKGATITKYRLVVGDYTEDLTYSDSAMVSSSTIIGATTGTYNVYAIDSRNNSTLVTKLASSEISYTPITINSSSKVERNDSGVGTSGILTYSGTYWNDDFGDEVNSIESVSYEFKQTSSQTWITGTTDITPTISNSDFSFTGIVRSNASDYSFDLATSYDFRITITDKLTTTVYVFTPLASGTPNLALSENGTAIGMAYDDSEGGAVQLIDDVKLYNRATDTWSLLGAGSGIPNDGVIGYDSNDTIPGGYEETNVDFLDYSTTEKVVGRWINNKPIYRKVIPCDFPSSSAIYIEQPHGISNIEMITDYHLIWYDIEDARWYNYFKDTTGTYYVQADGCSTTKFKIKSSSTGVNWHNRTKWRYAIIEYTKTTD